MLGLCIEDEVRLLTSAATFGKGCDEVCEEIGRDTNVGVANNQHVVLCKWFHLREFRDFGVRAG